MLVPILCGFIIICFLFWLIPVSRPRTQKALYFRNPVSNELISFPTLDDSASKYLSVIIPSYNEEKRLPKTIKELSPYLEGRSKNDKNFTYEVIIVDDGSKDKTTQVGLNWAREHPFSTDSIRVLTLEKNRGKGGAVTQGMMCARGEYIIFLDADGATNVEDFNKLETQIKKVEKNGLGVALGSRAHLVETEVVVKRSFIRNFLMYGFHMTVYLFGVRNIKDTQCGFKLFSRKAAKLIFPNMHVEGWIFDVEILYIAQQMGIPIVEVPVNWKEIEGSKMNLAVDSIKMAKDLILIRTNYLLRRWKIHYSN